MKTDPKPSRAYLYRCKGCENMTANLKRLCQYCLKRQELAQQERQNAADFRRKQYDY